jgi:F-type H+-transporting ATPase subunit b
MHATLGNPEFWVLVAFVIFFVLFGRRMWSIVAGMLDARAVAIRAELDEAARLRAEAEKMLRDALAEREAALAEAREVLARSHEEAARVTREAQADAQASAKRREQMALDRIAAAEKAVVVEVRQIAAELAVQASRDVIAATLTAERDAALVDEAIAGLPRALLDRQSAVSRQSSERRLASYV